MKDEILAGLENPETLEALYHSDKKSFTEQFSLLYPEISSLPVAQFWYYRLNYKENRQLFKTKNDGVLMAALLLMALLMVFIPRMFSFPAEAFVLKNISFSVFPLLMALFIVRNNLSHKNTLFITGCVFISLVFINILSFTPRGSVLALTAIYMPVLLWCVTGVVFTGNDYTNNNKRIEYLRFNGDLIVMTSIVGLAGMLFVGLTAGLFTVAGLFPKMVFNENIIAWLVLITPVAAAYLVITNPELVGKVSGVIAVIFSPLALVSVILYLFIFILMGLNPSKEREVLIVFNLLLAGVVALIFFSVSDSRADNINKRQVYVLFSLSLITIIINIIALSAIVSRLSEFGVSPNRMAVLGTNIVMLINLVITNVLLWKTIRGTATINDTGMAVAKYLSVYAVWSAVVVFVFPFIFSSK